MASPEQKRNVNHLVYDITIDELQQLTDLHTQQVIELMLLKVRDDIKERERERERQKEQRKKKKNID